jgi:hypothetical protein
MKNWQFHALTANIQIACALSATQPFTKGVFLFLAVMSLIGMTLSFRLDK